MATNAYGLDVDYFRRLCAREFNPEAISNQTPEDLARALARAARTACAEVLQEPEFQPSRAVVMPDRKPIEDDDPHAWQFEKGYNQALDDVARQTEGWRAHSARFAKGETPPKTVESLQAAWERDQEVMLEQRREIARLSQKLNQARQARQAPADGVVVSRDRLKKIHRDLDACQKVIWSGLRGADPAYCADAQECLAAIDALLAQQSAPSPVSGLVEALEKTLIAGRGTSGRIILDPQDEHEIRAALAAYKAQGGES